MSFFNRILSYLGSEILVQKLASNKTFQWFALSSVQTVQKISKDGIKAIKPDALPKIPISAKSAIQESTKEVCAHIANDH